MIVTARINISYSIRTILPNTEKYFSKLNMFAATYGIPSSRFYYSVAVVAGTIILVARSYEARTTMESCNPDDVTAKKERAQEKYYRWRRYEGYPIVCGSGAS